MSGLASAKMVGPFVYIRVVREGAEISGQSPAVFAQEWSDLIALLDKTRREDPRRWFFSLVFHDRYRTSFWVMRQLNSWGVETMARGAKKPAPTTAMGKKQWTTFVEISMAGHDLEKVRQHFGETDALFDAIQGMAVDGYRLSLSYNETNDSIIASCTCKDDDSPNAGCTFTSFAGDWVTALQVAAYKHYVVTEQRWVVPGSSASRPVFG